MSHLTDESFDTRHIGPSVAEERAMLAALGFDSIDALIDDTVPATIRLQDPLPLPGGLSERLFLRELEGIAAKNKIFRSYIGLGYNGVFTPPVIQRTILENPGWYTQYTPYQAEIAQGRLEALLNFQTMISDLTGMDVANASLLDEGTSAAEAMIMMHALVQRAADRKNSNKFFVSDTCYPQTIAVLETRAVPLGIEIVRGNHVDDELDPSYFGAIVQYPAQDGAIIDVRSFVEAAHAQGIMVVVAADLLSLVALTPPGEFGADIVVGSAQRFGVPMMFGGPHAGYFATRTAFIRHMPGRIIGVSVDDKGNPGFRMTLQTREQHIRREKATSNICTAQALLAIMAGMYAVYHGPDGLRRIARNVHRAALALARGLAALGYEQRNAVFFDTLKVRAADGEAIRQMAEAEGINFRYHDRQLIGITLDETVTDDDILQILGIFARVAQRPVPSIDSLFESLDEAYPDGLGRTSDFLTHPIFNMNHSETELLRYIKRLEGRDLSLAQSMISLGSCTMKLNATAELMPITWKEFAGMHPFAPAEQTEGYRIIFRELERQLCAITGFSAVSFQPNSGAQGEYAGLMVIRAYHEDHGAQHRNVVLIPSSAHGTNPASAVMAGMEVVVVKSDAHGNIDVDDLRTRAEQYKDTLAALMVTYPSTHGIFEESIMDVCRIIHDNGGLVYMDGANMNAQVGLTSPAAIGADVCHLNLHKTFAIPHGGGGPGVGPICVNDKLAPYLPGHPLATVGGAKAISAVSSAPWGSAGILVISYGYIRMLGARGVTDATKFAILNANYLMKRLAGHYPVLYTSAGGHCAHEFIVDLRPFKDAHIEAEDVAKRLMDYSFHAPTVSFPVAGTLMIEPTESESKAELDRFADALIAIRQEIQDVVDGKLPADDNPLHNAPHTVQTVTAEAWAHPYTREQAAFPLAYLRTAKFWPAVGRINNSYGDRNIMCVCPPIESYQNA